MQTETLSADRAADIVRRHTGARVTSYRIGDRGGCGAAWLLENEKLDAPEIYTDAGLVDFATELKRIFD